MSFRYSGSCKCYSDHPDVNRLGGYPFHLQSIPGHLKTIKFASCKHLASLYIKSGNYETALKLLKMASASRIYLKKKTYLPVASIHWVILTLMIMLSLQSES